MLNDIGMKSLLKNFLKMVLLLIAQHNVHQIHIMQVLLIMILMVFEKKDEKYDLLMMILKEVCEIVLLQHKIQHNLEKYEIIIYIVYVVMHIMQLNLILFKGNVNYDLKLLKLNKTVRLLHITIGEFWFDMKKKKRKRKQNNDSSHSNSSNDNNNNKQQDHKF